MTHALAQSDRLEEARHTLTLAEVKAESYAPEMLALEQAIQEHLPRHGNSPSQVIAQMLRNDPAVGDMLLLALVVCNGLTIVRTLEAESENPNG